MRRHIARAVLIAGVVIPACDGTSEDRNTTVPGSAPSATQGADSAAVDTGDIHAGHVQPAESAAGAPAHAAHGDDAPASGAHDAHAASTARAASASQTAHAAHAAVARRDTAHAAHAAVARPDSAHAAHATVIAGAAVAATRDTAHAAHATVIAGAAVAAARDTAHAAHQVTVQGAGMPAEHTGHATEVVGGEQGGHEMWMRPLGGGWMAMGMAQAYPIASASLGAAGSALDVSEAYVTQPAIMVNVESPGSRIVLRTTLNFEGITQADGEVTFGGWGEGFLDRRHPHTLLHEFMLSANLWNVAGGDLSLSAGKGFAPYGTDDPMSRPAVKYPTNHHLSQILERWTVNAVYVNAGWSLEAGLFGGAEPEGPYDFSNIESFGDSWSARVARRFGGGDGPLAETELSASFGRVREVHHEEAVVTSLYNAALRHERAYDFGALYGLLEASMSEPQDDDGYFSILGETQLTVAAHQPYYRIEYATRPEYEREGAPGTAGFFRYDHDSHAIGATRWLINTVGYGYELTGYPVSARPFVELQHSAVRAERGGIEPEALFGRRSFWGISAGFRVFFGGEPMRMGSYGVLDPMTTVHRGGSSAANAGHHEGHE